MCISLQRAPESLESHSQGIAGTVADSPTWTRLRMERQSLGLAWPFLQAEGSSTFIL